MDVFEILKQYDAVKAEAIKDAIVTNPKMQGLTFSQQGKNINADAELELLAHIPKYMKKAKQCGHNIVYKWLKVSKDKQITITKIVQSSTRNDFSNRDNRSVRIGDGDNNFASPLFNSGSPLNPNANAFSPGQSYSVTSPFGAAPTGGSALQGTLGMPPTAGSLGLTPPGWYGPSGWYGYRGMMPQGIMSPLGMTSLGMTPQGMTAQGMAAQGLMPPQGMMPPQGIMTPQGMTAQGMAAQGLMPPQGMLAPQGMMASQGMAAQGMTPPKGTTMSQGTGASYNGPSRSTAQYESNPNPPNLLQAVPLEVMESAKLKKELKGKTDEVESLKKEVTSLKGLLQEKTSEVTSLKIELEDLSKYAADKIEEAKGLEYQLKAHVEKHDSRARSQEGGIWSMEAALEAKTLEVESLKEAAKYSELQLRKAVERQDELARELEQALYPREERYSDLPVSVHEDHGGGGGGGSVWSDSVHDASSEEDPAPDVSQSQRQSLDKKYEGDDENDSDDEEESDFE